MNPWIRAFTLVPWNESPSELCLVFTWHVFKSSKKKNPRINWQIEGICIYLSLSNLTRLLNSSPNCWILLHSSRSAADWWWDCAAPTVNWFVSSARPHFDWKTYRITRGTGIWISKQSGTRRTRYAEILHWYLYGYTFIESTTVQLLQCTFMNY